MEWPGTVRKRTAPHSWRVWSGLLTPQGGAGAQRRCLAPTSAAPRGRGCRALVQIHAFVGDRAGELAQWPASTKAPSFYYVRSLSFAFAFASASARAVGTKAARRGQRTHPIGCFSFTCARVKTAHRQGVQRSSSGRLRGALRCSFVENSRRSRYGFARSCPATTSVSLFRRVPAMRALSSLHVTT
jgi:hypothetical protein